MTSTLSYVYCLVKAPRRSSLRDMPPGIGGGEVRVLDAGAGVSMIVTTVAESEYGEAALARGLQDLDWVGRQAMAHEAIVERFLDAESLLPMQLLTLFTNDERALQHVRRDRRRISAILTRVERQAEWGLRLTIDERAARRAPEESAALRRAAAGVRAGTAYLAHKRKQRDAGRARLAEAQSAADRVYRTLAESSSAAVRRSVTEQATPGSRLVLDAAFLVPRSRAASFRALVRRHVRPLGTAGVGVSLTGPWPPYNFIAARTAGASTGARARERRS